MKIFEELANNYTKIEIHDYIKEVNERLNKTLPKDKKLNLDFMDDFLKLCHTNEMCVPAELLIKYKDADSNDIKRFLEANDLKEEVDYRLQKILEPVPQGGFVNKNEYFLRPITFKYCLLCVIKIKELLKRSGKVLNKLTDINEILEETNDKLDTVLEDKVVFPEVNNLNKGVDFDE